MVCCLCSMGGSISLCCAFCWGLAICWFLVGALGTFISSFWILSLLLDCWRFGVLEAFNSLIGFICPFIPTPEFATFLLLGFLFSVIFEFFVGIAWVPPDGLSSTVVEFFWMDVILAVLTNLGSFWWNYWLLSSLSWLYLLLEIPYSACLRAAIWLSSYWSGEPRSVDMFLAAA